MIWHRILCFFGMRRKKHTDEGHEFYWLYQLVQGNQLKIINFITHKTKIIMATLQELKDAVASLQTSVDTKQSAIAAAIAALEAQIASGSVATSEDLQAVIDSLKVVQNDVDGTPTA